VAGHFVAGRFVVGRFEGVFCRPRVAQTTKPTDPPHSSTKTQVACANFFIQIFLWGIYITFLRVATPH